MKNIQSSKNLISLTLKKAQRMILLGRCLLNTEVCAPNWHHAEKADLCKSYWNPKRKMGVAMHFFEKLASNLNNNADISIFLEKKKETMFLHKFP